MENYKLSEDARLDMKNIYLRGLSEFGERQADTYYNGLFDHFEHIANDPLIYPRVDDIKKDYRRSVRGIQSIFYRLVEGRVEIMRILGRQDHSHFL